MSKIYVDAGTSWSKVLEIYKEEDELQNSPLLKIENLQEYNVFTNEKHFFDIEDNVYKGRTFLVPTKIFSFIDISLDAATGHMVKQKITPGGKYQNEIVSLAFGAQKKIRELENATIIDLGSRDLKWVKFENNKYSDLDWNGSCGSSTGATVEMLCKYYNIDPQSLKAQKEKISVTCGVFAMEKIMDNIVSDVPAEIAVARYIHGIAYNAWVFAKKPEKVYLSGGFCLNKCFADSLKFYCDVEPVGRFLLIEGLY